MKCTRPAARGFTLIELMIAMTLGLFLISAVIAVYLGQIRSVKSSSSQASIQNAENAIAALVTPVVRAAGYAGCTSLATSTVSNLIPGGSPPLGAMGSTSAPTPRFLAGYEATGTGPGGSAVISQVNSANDLNAAHWTPTLDTALGGNVEGGSDVLVTLGPLPGVSPVNVTTMAAGSVTFTVQDSTLLAAGQFGAMSTCLSSSSSPMPSSIVFRVTGIAGNTVTHAAGAGALNNVTDTLFAAIDNGFSHFLPLQQTAFYVSHGQGDQSTLMRATYDGAAWTAQPLVPGVDSMQVLYAITNSSGATQYVTANAVNDWTTVSAIRLGFLIEGQLGSGGATGAGTQQFSVLGTTLTMPADGRLRHVYEMSIKIRNTP